MFNSNQYIPILKWKRAEQGALKLLSEKQKKLITPLVQFVMPKPEPDQNLDDVVKKFEELLPEIPSKIIDAWGLSPIFVDVSLLFTNSLRAKSLSEILKKSRDLNGRFIPVIHLANDDEIKTAAISFTKETNNGLCIRLICADMDNVSVMNKSLADFLSFSGLNEERIDLLVDIKEIEENSGNYIKYLNLSQKISNLGKWRTFTFASGAFPENLINCKHDEENLIPRMDWICWKKYSSFNQLLRKPAYADYTIQHPIYKEMAQFFHPTTSIKYTLDDNWLIMKGQIQKFDQYLASAALLKQDKRFYGANFSEGDRYIAEKAKYFAKYMAAKKDGIDIKGTGSTETWLRAGINHHLVLVGNQVASQI